MTVLHRELVELKLLDPWVARIADAAGYRGDGDPFERAGNPRAFLRALYIALSLDAPGPALRGDLLLTLISALRASTQAPCEQPAVASSHG